MAQHSCIASYHVSEENALHALLHDASEAYLVDLARPIKHAPGLGEIYLKVEKQLEKVIAEKFGLKSEMPAEVKAVDNALLWTEKRDLMAGDWVEKLAGEAKYLPITIFPEASGVAEIWFLSRFHELQRAG